MTWPGVRYPGYGCRIKKFKVRGALDWLVSLGRLIQVGDCMARV